MAERYYVVTLSHRYSFFGRPYLETDTRVLAAPTVKAARERARANLARGWVVASVRFAPDITQERVGALS